MSSKIKSKTIVKVKNDLAKSKINFDLEDDNNEGILKSKFLHQCPQTRNS